MITYSNCVLLCYIAMIVLIWVCLFAQDQTNDIKILMKVVQGDGEKPKKPNKFKLLHNLTQ